jgi:RimJ/RimL family protein N-acetyltransferase
MLEFRPARPEDEDVVLRWRNEASTRAASFSRDKISAQQHHLWFTSMLADPDRVLFILEEDGQRIGQVRIDRVAPGLAEISIGLAPAARGRGVGQKALRRSVHEASRRFEAKSVKALVRRGNAASLAAFAAAGFRVVDEDDERVELLHGPDPGRLTG